MKRGDKVRTPEGVGRIVSPKTTFDELGGNTRWMVVELNKTGQRRLFRVEQLKPAGR